jgi:hypothetical protein
MNIVMFVLGLLFSSATIVSANLYQWTDEDGVIHVVDESSEVPRAYRGKVKVFESQKSRTPPSSLPLAPSRAYPANSEGRFAQKLALDLGLIKSRAEDAISPLLGAGIRPASGWRVNDELTDETVGEVTDAARRAANARRVSLSADGIAAIVQQAAASVFPPPPPVQEQLQEEPPQQVIIHQTPPAQIIEVERERVPVYVPVPVTPYYNHPYPPRYDPYPPQGPQPGNGPFAPAPPTGPHTDRWYVPQNPTPHSPSGQHTTNPGPSHMPFGTSHMPFGTGSSGRQNSFGR